MKILSTRTWVYAICSDKTVLYVPSRYMLLTIHTQHVQVHVNHTLPTRITHVHHLLGNGGIVAAVGVQEGAGTPVLTAGSHPEEVRQ